MIPAVSTEIAFVSLRRPKAWYITYAQIRKNNSFDFDIYKEQLIPWPLQQPVLNLILKNEARQWSQKAATLPPKWSKARPTGRMVRLKKCSRRFS
jgi:hypothetical protein